MIVHRIDPILVPVVDAVNKNNLITASCKDTIKEILCKGFFPQCSSDGSTATYATFTSACTNIALCGNNAVNINGIDTRKICSNSGQTVDLKSCVKYTSNVPGTSGNHNPCGPLPANITFPSLSIDDLARNRLIANSLNRIFQSQGVTTACTNQWYKMLCSSTPYCSPDQSKVLTAVTMQQCESAISW